MLRTGEGGHVYTIVTSEGGDAFTLATSGAGVVTTFGGSVFTAATGSLPYVVSATSRWLVSILNNTFEKLGLTLAQHMLSALGLVIFQGRCLSAWLLFSLVLSLGPVSFSENLLV